MSETTPFQQPEAESQISEAYKRIDLLTSDIVFDQEAQNLRDQLSENPNLQHYAALEAEELQATRDMYSEGRQGNHTLSNEHEATMRRAADAKSALSKEVAQEHDSLSLQLESITGHYKTRRFNAGSFEADVIAKIVQEAPRPQRADVQQAPAKDYAQNTEDAWKHMPDKAVRDYLGARTFFETDSTKLSVAEKRRLVVDADRDKPLEIPLDMIVNAAGFDSWLGREGYGSGKQVNGKYQDLYDGKIPSLDVVKHYASLPSELPPVTQINLYIQPNGVIFGDNSEGDSHRIAAAILRGDTTIKANHISIRCVDENWLEAAPVADELYPSSDVEFEQPSSSQTSNEHEIDRPREVLGLDELHDMLRTYGLDGSTAQERVEGLRRLPNELLALFMTDLNARLNGSEDSLIHEKTMKIGGRPTIAPEKRYDVFTTICDKLKASPNDINPARIGDALALSTVLLHPFKDGNGRTARILGFIFREDMTRADAQEDFSVLIEPRDKARERSGFMINGYIPYMGEGADQSDPAQVAAYIDDVLKAQDKSLYTGPYGQADL